MTEAIQLDLFDLSEESQDSILNGMYYERSSKKIVSYVLGRRHFEVMPSRCIGDKSWQEKIMRERAI